MQAVQQRHQEPFPLESRGCHRYEVTWEEELEPRPLHTPSGPTVRRSYQATPLMSLVSLTMKANVQLYQSFRQSIPTPRPPRLKRMAQSPQHNLSRTVQSPSQLSSPDVLREPDVPLSGLKIMTYVKHMTIDLQILIEYIAQYY